MLYLSTIYCILKMLSDKETKHWNGIENTGSWNTLIYGIIHCNTINSWLW